MCLFILYCSHMRPTRIGFAPPTTTTTRLGANFVFFEQQRRTTIRASTLMMATLKGPKSKDDSSSGDDETEEEKKKRFVMRCHWCSRDDTYRKYHDDEWGREQRSGRKLFEKVCLEGHQSGLSWITILKKREHYRDAFYGFDAEKMVDLDVEDLLGKGLVNHRGKIQSTINNAKVLIKHFGKGEKGEKKFSEFMWSFAREDGRDGRKPGEPYETKTKESEALSRALKSKEFSFVGATTMHALMQSVGMVDDHDVGCFMHVNNRKRKNNNDDDVRKIKAKAPKMRAKSISTMSAMERRNAKIAQQKLLKLQRK